MELSAAIHVRDARKGPNGKTTHNRLETAMILLITAFFMITALSIAAIMRLESEDQAARARRLRSKSDYRWVE